MKSKKMPHLQQGGTDECVPADLRKVFDRANGDVHTLLFMLEVMERMISERKEREDSRASAESTESA